MHKKIIKMVKKKLGIVVGKIKSKTNKHSKQKEGVSKANASQVPTLNVSTKIITPLAQAKFELRCWKKASRLLKVSKMWKPFQTLFFKFFLVYSSNSEHPRTWSVFKLREKSAFIMIIILFLPDILNHTVKDTVFGWIVSHTLDTLSLKESFLRRRVYRVAVLDQTKIEI